MFWVSSWPKPDQCSEIIETGALNILVSIRESLNKGLNSSQLEFYL